MAKRNSSEVSATTKTMICETSDKVYILGFSGFGLVDTADVINYLTKRANSVKGEGAVEKYRDMIAKARNDGFPLAIVPAVISGVSLTSYDWEYQGLTIESLHGEFFGTRDEAKRNLRARLVEHPMSQEYRVARERAEAEAEAKAKKVTPVKETPKTIVKGKKIVKEVSVKKAKRAA